ncbi:hypothetical protein ACX3VT_06400 [Aerococcus sanguinicola]|uniref:hypothetical protein n=1 Tax=unclassified Aerococcus TaxID=2618060 RepID=UPI0008A6200B|nr:MULTISPECIES: hypothetical protein [unclassified Aerococcus]KAB0647977.1 hypothetical protein F6I01_00625 [Aerococcus sanguinicola]MDK6233478.1 hypothetical protein [Aerococcus sp. UMB10185]MDK6805417.1 hypothetical protein [Aerococcus sp. UMB7834]MDK6855539.1 hypothetical protein [Aerococcus sp. UMB7533]OFN02381.1 hypothetical protein HMPREF2626_06465 [Aerococcus sp. HMSC062A02]
MTTYPVIMAIAGAVAIMGSVFLSYNLYQMIAMDAEARGMPRPRLWAFMSLPNGNGAGALPVYLVVRRKHTRRPFNHKEQEAYKGYKKKAKLSLLILLIGMFPLIFVVIHYLALS